MEDREASFDLDQCRQRISAWDEGISATGHDLAGRAAWRRADLFSIEEITQGQITQSQPELCLARIH
jgi:hypothetical protein